MEYEQNLNFKVLSNPLGINLDDETQIWKKSSQSYPQNISRPITTPAPSRQAFQKPHYGKQAPKVIHYSLAITSLKSWNIIPFLFSIISLELIFMSVLLYWNKFQWSSLLSKNQFVSIASFLAIHGAIYYIIFNRLSKKFQFKIPE